MRHFGHIAPTARGDLFFREPCDFDAGSPAPVLAAALGATLYSPATRPALADDVIKQAARGVVSMVLCLEDSIDDSEVADAEENLVRQFADLAGRDGVLPLLFIRVREPHQITDLVRRLGESARLLSGFVLPKFTHERGVPFMEALTKAEAEGVDGLRLFAMPVLESPNCCTWRPGGKSSTRSPAPSTPTVTGCSRCGSASPTSARRTDCAGHPT